MSAPLRRVRDPQPAGRGWELAVIGTAVVLGAMASVALAAVGIAASLWGHGWVWPAQAADVGPVVVGLIRGRLGAGYSAGQVAQLAGPVPTYVVIAVGEVLLTVAAVSASLAVRDRLRAGKTGMATRRQAEDALGVSRLRAARAVIRPDLDSR
ncbi:conjugal transfer protein [Klenkia taihuensis]|uniref:Conjugal transfer protein n=1 Tax=Klenkia taihuensis TaxID=1225127 RepID=A0A1I1U675_9ACTN|nr:conjugal transfer protein [Klenkia taihuensis]GHE06908.1 hypothetical protein GCM10011381_00670 [Klenkia taihuensis]SFD66194.1 hypothetical protein SAMN05661030_3932 [Klenkia taihuensis]